jgi:ubiquinone/menaquinone biosynthesis C-methylase UbiE
MSVKFDYAGEREYYANPVTQVRNWRWLASDMVHWVPGFPEVFRDKHVLDIGAGECLVTFVIAEIGQARCTVALELIHHRMLAARQLKLDGLGLVSGDCYSLPFPDERFDIVVGNGVLHHLPDEVVAASEIARVLKVGGVYFGREPNFKNPVVRRKVLGGHSTPNEHAITTAMMEDAFAQCGMSSELRYFWRRVSWLHHPWLSVSVAIEARKVGCSV